LQNDFYRLAKSSRITQKNEIAPIPTETVYGLAGNAFDVKAVSK